MSMFFFKKIGNVNLVKIKMDMLMENKELEVKPNVKLHVTPILNVMDLISMDELFAQDQVLKHQNAQIQDLLS